jgi:hypothetical protein
MQRSSSGQKIKSRHLVPALSFSAGLIGRRLRTELCRHSFCRPSGISFAPCPLGPARSPDRCMLWRLTACRLTHLRQAPRAELLAPVRAQEPASAQTRSLTRSPATEVQRRSQFSLYYSLLKVRPARGHAGALSFAGGLHTHVAVVPELRPLHSCGPRSVCLRGFPLGTASTFACVHRLPPSRCRFGLSRCRRGS